MKDRSKLIIALVIISLLAIGACACSNGEVASPLGSFPASDMTGYSALDDYKGALPFVGVTVQDVHKLIEEKQTFALFISFPSCPWCNAVINQFIEVANTEGAKVASINTRKNPEWVSNLDIDDYDLFVEDFGEFLDYDDNGIKHLYVPHVFFIKNGEVVYEHQGAIPEMGSDPYMELTEAQNEALKDIYREGFKKLK